MPWGEITVEQLREQFVNEVIAGEQPKLRLCAKYGISRVTGDKWLQRFENGAGLSNQSRAHFHSPNKTDCEMESRIIEVRHKHPAWGPRKIVRFLENAGVSGLPWPSTVSAILKRNGLVTVEASRAATPYKRFQRESPNDLWQADFKGHIAMLNGFRCHPLTVLDDHSRYALCVDAKDNERHDGVVESFKQMFSEYGLPDSILCDNGNPWGTSQSTGFTLFEVWLLQLDVLPIHGRPRHPQTQGKDERFNRTLKDEVLKYTAIEDLEHAQQEFDRFRDCYNHERPHDALGLDTPFTHYLRSDRRMADNPVDWEYPSGHKSLKVKSSGYVTIRGQGYFLSEAFGGQTLSMRDSSLKDCINLYYRNFRIARINMDDRVFVSRKIYRYDCGD